MKSKSCHSSRPSCYFCEGRNLTCKGFSLLELLIVLAVMGVLAAVMIPSFSKINEKAKVQALSGTVHGVQIAVEGYRLDNGHYPTGNEVVAVDLIETLKTDGYLRQTPTNPFTGAPYTDSDPAGQIKYTYDDSTDSYQIQGFGPGNAEAVVDVSPL